MGENFPKITIITPVFNNVHFIESCIVSILNQNYPNLEYIVIDGGSNDGTLEIIENYAEKLTYFVSEKDRGQTHALNKGFAKATGQILAWLNADEEYLPGTLLEVGKNFKNYPDLDFYYGQRIIVDINKNEIGRKYFPKMSPKYYMLYGMRVLPTDATFWSERVHKLSGTLDEKNFPRLSMDYDWLLRISFHVKKWKHSKNYFSKFTERDDRSTRSVHLSTIEKNGTLIRKMIISKYGISKFKLVLGWFLVHIKIRFYEDRLFKIPRIISSFKHIIKTL